MARSEKTVEELVIELVIRMENGELRLPEMRRKSAWL